ncbi:SufD family Fe-S cluster assembly protein [Brucepastera parasyntrophica]|uniref:SufB/SufD family protein n=1 Tax=Brucepastera parasyntrophica TaxID=2880008 RepID=UPI002109BBA7|nr:SufD family Fe-S cluster assembly protein [Brucepastera parasyntrophica]ULQ59510.1 SufD family Fe-S cluster assembly protein [Brucepastera parasyntrophica]
MNDIQKKILQKISGIMNIPKGAYNIRINGSSIGSGSTEDISIVPKENNAGMDIYIKPGTKHEHVHIPVIISQGGIGETVYNDFHIGENADVTIIAGCGIHNNEKAASRHDGIHTFHIAENARVVYREKHYGEGSGQRILNPVTNVYMEPGSYMEMDTVQIEGVDSTKRITRAELKDGAKLVIKEKLMTHERQTAETEFLINLDGKESATTVSSRSVAKGDSRQIFLSKINGNASCMGHSECDAIIMDNAGVQAIPEITANHSEASLIHEAAIGKIAGEQIIKLMTLGLDEEESIEQIINGFLK